MKERIKKSLSKKNWPKKEVDRVIESMEKAEKDKGRGIKILDEIVYWLVLIVTIIGTMVISIVLMPFLIVFNYIRLYTIIIIISFAFGLLFDLLLKDLRDLNRKHYVIAGFFIPSFAIINMVFMTQFANHLMEILKVNHELHNPASIGIVYVVAFIAPAAFARVRERFNQ